MPIIVLAAATVMQAQPVPLNPWQAGLIENNCGVIRTYRSDAGPVLIEITRPVVGSQRLRVVLPKAMDPGKRNERLEVAMQPEGISFVAKDVFLLALGNGRPTERPDPSAIVETADGRVVRRVEDKVVEPLAKAQVLQVKVGARPPIILDTVGANEAVTALNACFKTKITAAGLSEGDFVPAHTPAEAINPASWITHNDYPKDALSRKLEGSVHIVFFVETDGRVKDCRVLSDTPPLLNDTTCALIRQRGRYKPARDAVGLPVRSMASRKAVWSLPR